MLISKTAQHNKKAPICNEQQEAEAPFCDAALSCSPLPSNSGSGSLLPFPIAYRFSMDEAGTCLFKEQDKWAETVPPSPNSLGNAQEFHLTLGQRCALKQSAV